MHPCYAETHRAGETQRSGATGAAGPDRRSSSPGLLNSHRESWMGLLGVPAALGVSAWTSSVCARSGHFSLPADRVCWRDRDRPAGLARSRGIDMDLGQNRRIVGICGTMALVVGILAAVGAEGSQGGPEGWTTAAPRDEIRPAFSYQPDGGVDGRGCLVIKADHREGLDGYWKKEIPVTGGK